MRTRGRKGRTQQRKKRRGRKGTPEMEVRLDGITGKGSKGRRRERERKVTEEEERKE